MCVLWFWAEGRRQCQELGVPEEGRPCRESAAFCSSHRDLHNSGPGDLHLWSRVTPGCLKSMGEAYQEKPEMDGRTGASTDGADEQAGKDAVTLRISGAMERAV